jgi:hypothetical protein
MFRSAERPHRLKGPTVAVALLDEADQMEALVHEIVLSRVRDPHAATLALGCVGTPEQYGSWLHERCEGERAQDGDHVVRADREAVTGLPPEYYNRMRESYDEATFAQYGDGKWVLSDQGLIYTPPFSDDNLRRWTYRQGEPVYIGLDFNYTPFCFQAYQEDGEGNVYAFREWRLPRANTQTVADTLRIEFPQSRVEIWADAAGNQDKTGQLAGTDVEILRRGGFDVYWTWIKRRNDRYNATRGMLCNADGRRRLFLDPESVPMLIREMRTLTHEQAAKQAKAYDSAGRALLEGGDHSTSAQDYLMLGRYNPVFDRAGSNV